MSRAHHRAVFAAVFLAPVVVSVASSGCSKSDDTNGTGGAGGAAPATCASLCELAVSHFCVLPNNLTCDEGCPTIESACPGETDALLACAGPAPDITCIGIDIDVLGCSAETQAWLDCSNLALFSCNGVYAGKSTPTDPVASYVAAESECAATDIAPADCRREPTAVLVDADTGTGTSIYLRFDLDQAFAAGTVRSVKLKLATAGSALAESARSGELWEVEPFTVASLASGLPGLVGATALAADPGPVAPCSWTEWELPLTSASPGATLYLAITPGSSAQATDGASYVAKEGDAPPELVIEY